MDFTPDPQPLKLVPDKPPPAQTFKPDPPIAPQNIDAAIAAAPSDDAAKAIADKFERDQKIGQWAPPPKKIAPVSFVPDKTPKISANVPGYEGEVVPPPAVKGAPQPKSKPIDVGKAITSPWTESPLGLTPDASKDLEKSGLPGPVQAGIRGLGIAGDVVGKGFESINRGIGSAAGRAAQYFGADDTTAHQLERDFYALPAALTPLAAEPRAPRIEEAARPEAPAAKPTAAAEPPTKAPTPKAGPVLEPPKPAEKPVETGRRWDDAANRLQTNDDASKMEARTFVNKLPKELKNPQIWEKVHNEIEQRLVDPKAKLSPDAQKAYDQIKPWEDRARSAAEWIRAHGLDDKDLPGLDSAAEGYSRRIVKGHEHALDRLDPNQQWERDPIMSTVSGAKSLSKYAPSLKARQFFVLQGKDGTRTMLPPDSELKPGMKTQGGVVKQATTSEIEALTASEGRPIEYHKNYAVNTIDNALRLERVQRNMQVLDGITKEMNDKGLMWKSQWPIEKMADGTWRYARNQRPRPEGYKETNIPQLRDHYFPAEIADTLNDIFRGEEHGPFLDTLARVNRVLNGSLFWNPIPHQMNVTADFIQNRGWDWVNPMGYRRLMVNGSRAFNAIRTRNPDYVNFMREGAGLHLPAIENKNFFEGLLTKFGEEVRRDPTKFDQLAQSIGLKHGAEVPNAILRMVKSEYGLSSKAMWVVDDFLKMTRYLELQDKGIAPREAIALAEKDMASYRVPPTVAGSRGFAQFFKSPIFQSFGRYHYSKLRSLGLIFRDLVKGTRQEKIDASGKLAVMGAMLYLLKPLMDAGAQRLTGEKKAQFNMPGATGVAGRAMDLALPRGMAPSTPDNGDYVWQRFISSFMNPSPIIAAGTEAAGNKDFMGRPIIEPRSTPLGKTVQGAEAVGGLFGPTATAIPMAQPGGTKREMARQIDITVPRPTRAKYRQIPARQARSRERKDPIEGWLRRILP